GMDDCDLYSRLGKRAKRMLINLDKIQHIEHSDKERTENQKALSDSTVIAVEIEINRQIAALDIWKGEFWRFHVFKRHSGYFLGSWLYGVRLNPEILGPIVKKAKTTHGQWGSITATRTLTVELLNGLCNKLRALGSAIVISRELKLKLIIHWVPDKHCGAR